MMVPRGKRQIGAAFVAMALVIFAITVTWWRHSGAMPNTYDVMRIRWAAVQDAAVVDHVRFRTAHLASLQLTSSLLQRCIAQLLAEEVTVRSGALPIE